MQTHFREQFDFCCYITIEKLFNTVSMFLKAMSHEAIFLATCNAMALHCKLQRRLPRVTPHVCNQSCNEKLRCKLQRKQKQLLLFTMLRDKLQRVTPPLQLFSQFFEKEPITIRHNQNTRSNTLNRQSDPWPWYSSFSM